MPCAAVVLGLHSFTVQVLLLLISAELRWAAHVQGLCTAASGVPA